MGKAISYDKVSISTNVTLVYPFERFDSSQTLSTKTPKIERTDRSYKSFFFCPNESCINTFESEDELNAHILIDQHTTKESSLRTTDQAKLILFERIRGVNNSSVLHSTATATANTPSHLPRHYKYFTTHGWALRFRKPAKPIDKAVKEFIIAIFEEERTQGK